MLRICPGYKSRSPGKALCAAPGELAIVLTRYGFPEAMLRICPGYRSHTAMDS